MFRARVRITIFPSSSRSASPFSLPWMLFQYTLEAIKGGRAAAPAGTHHTGAHLPGLVKMGTVKQAIQQGNQGWICRRVVNRGCHHQAIRSLELGRNFIHDIIEHAFPSFRALAAGNAAANGLLPHLDGFNRDTLLGKSRLHLPQCNGRIAARPRAAVEHEYFHKITSCFSNNPLHQSTVPAETRIILSSE